MVPRHCLAEPLWGINSHCLPLLTTDPLDVQTQMFTLPNGSDCSSMEEIKTHGALVFLGEAKKW